MTSNVRQVISLYNELHRLTSTESDAALLEKANTLLDECTYLLKDTPGNTTSAQGSAKDKYAEEKYKYLTEYGTQILALFTPSGNCTYLSRNFERLTGHKIDSGLDSVFFKLIHPDFRERLKNTLNPVGVAAQTAPAQVMRLKMQHGDGKYYWYQFTLHNKPEHYICLIENIHEHMQTQSTLQKARLEAELALRARSEFLANMSHELRTPLNAVIGFSQIMERGVFGKIENPQYSGYIRHIQESGHDLLAKIEDLLEIANIDAGRVSLNCEEIYVNDLINHVINAQLHHAQDAKVSLSYVPRGNPLLFVDRIKIQHILGHLVANAIKYNNAGGEVTIEVGRDGKSGIRLSVHDDGVGINELKCHDIRESLQQENCWTAKNNQHIGIGLALTKEFAALHGGSVEISSSNGIGTTVSITLPRECIRMVASRKDDNIKQLELENG
jgi:PAS domain S-box-containing protein